MVQAEEISRRTLRLPQDVTRFLDVTAKRRMTSTNAEIVRILRERMTAATGETLQGEAPAAAQNDTARQSGPINTHA